MVASSKIGHIKLNILVAGIFQLNRRAIDHLDDIGCIINETNIGAVRMIDNAFAIAKTMLYTKVQLVQGHQVEIGRQVGTPFSGSSNRVKQIYRD